MLKHKIRNWHTPPGQAITDFDRRILDYQNSGELVPTRNLIKTPEQIEGIRQSGIINTGILDLLEEKIKVGMSTAEIDRIVYDYTTAHGAVRLPLEAGDFINVDVSTILNGYYSDASRMYIIGKTTSEKKRLVQVAKECLDIGAAAAKPWGFIGDIGKAISKHAHKNGFSVVRDLCGHGVG